METKVRNLHQTQGVSRWDSLEQVEWETVRWVAWFNHDRIYEALGDTPPAEFEDNHYRQDAPTELAGVT